MIISVLYSFNINQSYFDMTVLKYVLWNFKSCHSLEYLKKIPKLFLNFKMDF